MMKKYFSLLLLAITAPFCMGAAQEIQNNETMEVSYSTSTKGVGKMPFFLTLGSVFSVSFFGPILALIIYLRTGWRAEYYNREGYQRALELEYQKNKKSSQYNAMKYEEPYMDDISNDDIPKMTFKQNENIQTLQYSAVEDDKKINEN